jgi:hypothetical protein
MSYGGAAGAILGFGFNVALGVAILAGASEESAEWSVPFFPLALMFVPAAVVSLTPSGRRDLVLRITVMSCLVAAIGGTVFFGPEYAFVMALPTFLLAQGAGLIWQGGTR